MLQIPNAGLQGLTIVRSGLLIQNTINTGATQTFANDTLYLTPIHIARPVTIDAIQVQTLLSLGAGSVYRVGIYASNAQGLPSAVLHESALFDGTVVTTRNAPVTLTLAPGIYWLAVVQHDGTLAADQWVRGQTNLLMPTIGISSGGTRAGFSVPLTRLQPFPANPSTSTVFGFNCIRQAVRIA